MTGKQRATQEQMPPMLHVRRSVWGILLAAVLVAVAIPATNLWHASSAALHAHVYLSPAAPRAGEPAQIVVVLPNPTDRAAVQGPWAKAVAQWDMLTMTMGARQRAVPGAAATAEVFTIPLCLDMAGPWWAHIVIQTPSRPEWHSSLQFDVQAPHLSTLAARDPTTTAVTSQAISQRSGCT
jgi:hypothetical protein